MTAKKKNTFRRKILDGGELNQSLTVCCLTVCMMSVKDNLRTLRLKDSPE